MSFPVVIHGSEGEIYNTHTSKEFPYGTRITLQDGRAYRYALNGAVTGVAGQMQQAAVNTTNHLAMSTQAAAALAARTVSVSTGATDVVINEYAEGWLSIETTGYGGGYAYKVDSHAARTGAGTLAVNLGVGHAVQAILTATTSKVCLLHSPYYKVIVCPVTRTQVPVGVAVMPMVAAQYYWLQTNGPCNVQTQGTVVLGNPVTPSLTTAGAISPLLGSGAITELQVGSVMRLAATTDFSLVMLHGLDG